MSKKIRKVTISPTPKKENQVKQRAVPKARRRPLRKPRRRHLKKLKKKVKIRKNLNKSNHKNPRRAKVMIRMTGPRMRTRRAPVKRRAPKRAPHKKNPKKLKKESRTNSIKR